MKNVAGDLAIRQNMRKLSHYALPIYKSQSRDPIVNGIKVQSVDNPSLSHFHAVVAHQLNQHASINHHPQKNPNQAPTKQGYFMPFQMMRSNHAVYPPMFQAAHPYRQPKDWMAADLLLEAASIIQNRDSHNL